MRKKSNKNFPDQLRFAYCLIEYSYIFEVEYSLQIEESLIANV